MLRAAVADRLHYSYRPSALACPFGLTRTSEADREIVTTKRGKRIATSIDGTLTGLGGNLIIIDDPLKLGDAMSEAVRSASSNGTAEPRACAIGRKLTTNGERSRLSRYHRRCRIR